MYGAILGDIIGSPYEFDRGDKTKTFSLFSDGSHFTDDTVMTIAVAEALMEIKDINAEDDEDFAKLILIRLLKEWGRKYPRAGYGRRFHDWLNSCTDEPYGSYGNGAAMRVSSVGWLFGDIATVERIARWTAEVTHNHPEGIKGAVCTACCVFIARTGGDYLDIAEYVKRNTDYDINRSCDSIRPFYRHVESCQKTVPEAIVATLEAKSYEDAIRNAVSLGGDTDTLACIAGGIAEAQFGVPVELIMECRRRLPSEALKIIDRFERVIGRYKYTKDKILSYYGYEV